MIIESNFLKKYGRFEIFYMLVMVIYMAQATPETGRMIGGLSGNPIPFLLPIILTYMLWRKYPISFNNRKFYFVLIIYGIWAICSLIKYGIYTTEELSYHFFMVYAIVIAYIHNKIYGYTLVPIYEQILVFFCKIAIVGWLIAVLIPASSSFFHLFPETAFGNHVLYLFNWMDPAKGQIYSGIVRNAGCSWEPGRFAIMVTLAIFCNLCQNGIKFRNNKNIWWLLIALITTQSTTGYITALVLYTIFMVKKFNFKYISLFILVMIPVIYGLMQLDFMAEKIDDRFKINEVNERFLESEAYYSRHEGLDRHIALDRFQSIYFEWKNFLNDPILGYSRDFRKSLFAQSFISDYGLTGGLVSILSQYGIFLGLFIYYLLFHSSFCISRQFKYNKKYVLAICLILSSISYPIFGIPIFTTFWFYGFSKNKM